MSGSRIDMHEAAERARRALERVEHEYPYTERIPAPPCPPLSADDVALREMAAWLRGGNAMRHVTMDHDLSVLPNARIQLTATTFSADEAYLHFEERAGTIAEAWARLKGQEGWPG